MSARERAILLLENEGLEHVIYGYVAKMKRVETDWESKMWKFRNDDDFCNAINKLQTEIEGLEQILAVHA